MKRYALSNAIHFAANTMLKISKHYTPFLAFQLFFGTLPIIWAQAATRFLVNPRWRPFKSLKNVQHPNTRAIPVD
jgi:hypothetical protein